MQISYMNIKFLFNFYKNSLQWNKYSFLLFLLSQLVTERLIFQSGWSNGEDFIKEMMLTLLIIMNTVFLIADFSKISDWINSALYYSIQ